MLNDAFRNPDRGAPGIVEPYCSVLENLSWVSAAAALGHGAVVPPALLSWRLVMTSWGTVVSTSMKEYRWWMCLLTDIILPPTSRLYWIWAPKMSLFFLRRSCMILAARKGCVCILACSWIAQYLLLDMFAILLAGVLRGRWDWFLLCACSWSLAGHGWEWWWSLEELRGWGVNHSPSPWPCSAR